MNPVIKSLFARRSVRAFSSRPISEEDKNLIIDAGIQAPSAGNQQLYTILDIEDQAIKERLAVLCDNQPFIAAAPVVLVFLADCRRWLDCYRAAGVDARLPGPGDLILACEDALIAAQNMVTAAGALGIGSCYIGDILENKEDLTELLRLDPLVFPVTMVVFGYPRGELREDGKPSRPHRRYLVRKNTYSPPDEQELREMYRKQYGGEEGTPAEDFDSFMTAFCRRKYMSAFSLEMNRSAGEYLKPFLDA